MPTRDDCRNEPTRPHTGASHSPKIIQPRCHAAVITIILAGLSSTLSACQQPLAPIFPEIKPAIVWPPPPDQPRIRYIGDLVGEESLKARKSGGEKFRELLAGPSPKTGFSTPNSVAVHDSTVYVSDGQSHCVFMLDLAARTIKPIIAPDGKPLLWPIDICIAGDTLAICDSQRASVFLCDLQGKHKLTLGAGSLKRPSAVTFVECKREWWVLDTGEHAIVIYDDKGTPVRTFGTRGDGPGEFNFPAGFASVNDYGVVVADSMNFRVQVFDPATGSPHPHSIFGKKGDAAGDFALPRDVASDADGNLYILDSQFENIQIFDRRARLLMALGGEGRKPGEFYLPSGITIDEQDRIWVADTYNRRIQVFQYLREDRQ